MKKITSLLVMAVAMTLSPALLRAVNSVSYTVTYNSELSIGTDTLGGVVYTTVYYPDLYNGGAPGMPSLPVDYIKFSVPYNATNFTVTTTTGFWTNNYVDNMVYPCQIPVMMGSEATPGITLPDSAACSPGATYPTHRAWVVDEGFLAGENHIVTVAVMPCSYSHSSTSDLVRKYRRITVNLHYELSDTPAMYPIVREDSALRQQGYALTRSMVVNPSNVYTFAPSTSTFIDTTGLVINPIIPGEGTGPQGVINPPGPINPPGFDSTYVNPNPGAIYEVEYPYLIVTTSDLVSSVRRIAALKRQMGYNVKIVTMDEVLSDPYASQGDICRKQDGTNHVAFSDSAGVLRQYLKKCFNTYGTQYVLFVGDIPYRIISIDSIPNNRKYDADVLTELYFSDLNSTWLDANADRQPELYVGRIPAMSGNRIDNYTNKLFIYMLNPGNGDFDYLQKAFFSEGREFNGYQSIFKAVLGRILPNQVIMNDFEGNNSRHPTGIDVIDALNSNPVSFISIFNHGGTTNTKVYGPDVSGKNYYLKSYHDSIQGNELNSLHNKLYPLIWYSQSCHTMPFDNKSVTNFGESFITGKDYGGPVYIGYTRTSYSDYGSFLSHAFANKIVSGHYNLGEAYSLEKTEYGNSVEVYLQAFFGDPELEMWTDVPQKYENIQVVKSDNTISISGIDAFPCLISYIDSNNEPKCEISNDSVFDLYDFSPSTTVMLRKHNSIPYITPLDLQNVNISRSQYVIAKDVMAGNHVNTNRSSGDVTVKSRVTYEIEAKGTVSLNDGFKVEKGAVFAVYPASF